MTFAVGENVGPYRVIEQLGQGGMATVFKAYHAALDRYVALKVLHPAFLEDPNFLARFQREARLVAKLEHPNIVPIYDFSEHAGQPYLVMKFIEGETLKARLTNETLRAEDILRVVDAVGAALAYAHRQGILHRDVKPSNVILAEDGQIYLADFGLARIAQSGESTLSSDMILGTPQYISPEQAMGAKDLDARTDIYSFGVMIYEMVVGRVPFSSDTPFSIIHDHIYSPLPLPHEINPNISPELERMLLKALAKDREDRFSTIEEMVSAFRQAWTEQPIAPRVSPSTREAATIPPQPQAVSKTVSPPPPTSPQKKEEATPASSSGKWGWIAAGVLLIILVAFVAIALKRPFRKPAAETPKETAPHMMEQHGGGESPNIEAAHQAVDENPESPAAHAKLSIALWSNDEFVESMDEMILADELAQDNPDLLLKMANAAYDAEYSAVAPAALLYAHYVSLMGPDSVPPEILDRMDECIYESSAYPELGDRLHWEKFQRVNPLMAMVAEARFHYYSGHMERAENLIQQAFEIEPNYPPAILLEAEVAEVEGRNDDAEALLSQLEAMDTPDWIRMEMDFIRQDMNQ